MNQDLDAAEQTKEDLRSRLAELFRSYEADGKDGKEPWQLIAVKLIVTLSGEILRDLKSPVRDTRKQAEATLSALRLFGLEDLYRACCESEYRRKIAPNESPGLRLFMAL